MNKKVVSIVLIVVGTALMWWGYDVYDSAGSQVTRAISGDTPMEAWLGLVGGAVLVLVGLFRIK